MNLDFKLRIVDPKQKRSCARCGKQFIAFSREYTCTDCRKPKLIRVETKKDLTFRENQIVNCVCQAKTNKEIAYELSLSEGTIKEYLYRIFRKLGVTNRTELALYGIKVASIDTASLPM